MREFRANPGYQCHCRKVSGPAGKGLYTLFFIITNTIMNSTELGLGDATVYVVNSRNYRMESIIFVNVVTVLLLSLFGVGMALGVFGFRLFPEMTLDNTNLLALVLLAIPLLVLRKHVLDLLRAQRSFAEYNKTVIIEDSCYFCALALLITFVKIDVNHTLILYLFNLTFIILLTFHYLTRHRPRIAYRIDFRYVWEILSYGLKIYVGNIFRTLYYRVDSLIVGAFFSLAVVGYYSIAASLVQTATLIGYSIGAVILPVISQPDSSNDRHIIFPILRVSTFLSVLFCVGIYAFGKICIRLFFGQAFLPATGSLYLMAPTALFTNLSVVLSYYFVGIGRGIISSYSSVILLVSTVLFAILLIPHLRIGGAALAVSISSFIQAVFLFQAIRKEGSYGFGELLVLRKSDLLYLRRLI